MNAAEQLVSRHYSGGLSSTTNGTTAQGTTNTLSQIIVWTGANTNFFLDNIADGTVADVGAIAASANILQIGRSAVGAPVIIGQLCVWKNYQLTAGDRTAFHGGTGTDPPQFTDLVVWIRGTNIVAVEERKGVTGINAGTIVLAAHASDNYWPVDAGGFAIFLSSILGTIFGRHLIEHADLFGPGSFREPLRSLRRVTDQRCIFDWQPQEMRRLMESFERRPVYG